MTGTFDRLHCRIIKPDGLNENPPDSLLDTAQGQVSLDLLSISPFVFQFQVRLNTFSNLDTLLKKVNSMLNLWMTMI